METTNSIPWYKSTKKTLGVIGAMTLYGSFVMIILLFAFSDNPNKDPDSIIEMAKIVALYSASCLAVKVAGGVFQKTPVVDK